MLQSKGKTFTKEAENFSRLAEEGEEVLASVQIGISTWLLTNQRMVSLSLTGEKIKVARPLSSIESARLAQDKLGLDQLFITEAGRGESKLGSMPTVGPEFLELLLSTLKDGPAPAPQPQVASPQELAPPANGGVVDRKEQKRQESAQKKADRAEVREKKREAEKQRKAADQEKYGREIMSEMLGLKTVKFFEKGFVHVGWSDTYEKLLGIEGSADNLQKKSAAGRAAGFVFTGGLNMLGSNKRGDLLITITTDKKVHTLHLDAPYAHDVKSYQRIVAVGKSLLSASEKSESATSAPAKQSLTEEIEKLVSLRDSGVLSDQEFQQAKDRILNS